MQTSVTGLALGQFIITLRAESHNPTILNPDFLKNQGIVGSDWEMAEEPVCVRQFARVAYSNGVSIIAEFDNLIFSEDFWPRGKEPLLIAPLAAKYVQTLPHVNYQAVVNNPMADLIVSEADIDSFVRERFIREGPWMELNQGKARAEVEFRYEIASGSFTLSVQQAVRRPPDGDPQPVILFDGEFTRHVSSVPAAEQAVMFINQWESDLKLYFSFLEAILQH